VGVGRYIRKKGNLKITRVEVGGDIGKKTYMRVRVRGDIRKKIKI